MSTYFAVQFRVFLRTFFLKLTYVNNALLRYGITMMYLNLGQDDDAYKFVKYWLKKSKKRSGGPNDWKAFIMIPGNKHPISYSSMEGQNKKENLLQALNIDIYQEPCYLDCLFYIYLAIIKCNTMAGMPKDERAEQELHLKV